MLLFTPFTLLNKDKNLFKNKKVKYNGFTSHGKVKYNAEKSWQSPEAGSARNWWGWVSMEKVCRESDSEDPVTSIHTPLPCWQLALSLAFLVQWFKVWKAGLACPIVPLWQEECWKLGVKFLWFDCKHQISCHSADQGPGIWGGCGAQSQGSSCRGGCTELLIFLCTINFNSQERMGALKFDVNE